MLTESEIKSLEPRFKEILYQCLEDIRATKAALYLTVSVDDRYTMVTQYGYRDQVRKEFASREELIDRMIVKRSPFYLNSVAEDPRFSELLFNADTSRMLIAPILIRGKLVGFIDMRDKAARELFTPADIDAAQRISDRFIELFNEKTLFAQRTVPVPQPGAIKVSPVLEQVSASPEMSVETTSTTTTMSPAAQAVSDARRAIGRGTLRPRQVETLSEAQVAAGATVLPSILAVPGVVMASFSSFGRLGGYQTITATGEVTDDALEGFQARLRGWLQKRGEPDGLSRTSMVYPQGQSRTTIEPDRLVSMLSAPVNIGVIRGLVLTVAFEQAPSAEAKAQLSDFLHQIQNAVTNAMDHESLRSTLQRVAEKLLEPDFQSYPPLEQHARRVSELAERFGQYLGMPPAEIETIRLAAYVHDVGMRLLDYDRLYRKKGVTADDLKVLRQHPMVGAALVADSALGPEIANLVLRHHERPDGTGYPDGVDSQTTPVGSRIIHLCESYDAMTAEDSYQAPVPEAQALSKIRRAAGTQFDEELATKFIEMLGGAA